MQQTIKQAQKLKEKTIKSDPFIKQFNQNAFGDDIVTADKNSIKIEDNLEAFISRVIEFGRYSIGATVAFTDKETDHTITMIKNSHDSPEWIVYRNDTRFEHFSINFPGEIETGSWMTKDEFKAKIKKILNAGSKKHYFNN